MSEKKTRLEQALDLFLYAPLGLALTARDELPRLVEKGRKQFSEQMTTAKVMGEYALAEGQRDLEQRTKQVSDTLGGLLRSRRQSPAPPPAPSAPPLAATPVPAAESSPVPAAPRPSDDGLAIHGYDALSASQVVQRLAGLSRDELEAVQAYESATRGRKTILHRVDQLQSGPAV